MQKKYEVESHAGYTIIRKKVHKNILEIDSRKPSIIYMQYGYSNGIGPWHCTSAIQYNKNSFGYDTPDIWNKKVRENMQPMFDFSKKVFGMIK